MGKRAADDRSARIDPRVRRSRRALKEALLALLREKDFDAISVQDITGRAELNRATFYLHYQDKEELLTQTMTDVLDELEEVLRRGQPTPNASAQGVPEVFAHWFHHVAEHSKLYLLMLGPEGMPRFAAQVRGYLERLMTPWIARGLIGDNSGIPPALRSRFLTSAFLGVIAWWLEHGRHQSADQMAAWLWSLTASIRWNEER